MLYSLSLAQIDVFLSWWVSLSQTSVSPSSIPLSAHPSLFPPLSTTFYSFDLGLESGWDRYSGSCETKISGRQLWSNGQLGLMVGQRVGFVDDWPLSKQGVKTTGIVASLRSTTHRGNSSRMWEAPLEDPSRNMVCAMCFTQSFRCSLWVEEGRSTFGVMAGI